MHRDRDRLIEEATRIVAQVDHEAFDLIRAELASEVCDRLLQVVGGLLVELGDADVADIVTLGVRAHRFHPDYIAHDRHVDRLIGALAHDGQLDPGVHRPAHLFHGLVERQALNLLVVELDDDVVGHDAGLGSRGVINRRDHLYEPVLYGDLDAQPAELAAGLHLNVAEALRVHIARVRIEPGQHAVDRRCNQLVVIRLLDIVRAHPFEHVAE